MNGLISRQALCEYALNQKDKSITPNDIMRFPAAEQETCVYWDRESNFCALHRPSAHPEIIRCNTCKHWTQSTGKMKGYGLGRCDFHGADLVTCNGFCYWAERRNDE